MNPFILLLIFGAFGLGNSVGKASAQQRIQELQKEILRLQQVQRMREEEVAGLRAHVRRIEQENNGLNPPGSLDCKLAGSLWSLATDHCGLMKV